MFIFYEFEFYSNFLKAYCLVKDPFSTFKRKDMNKVISKEICQEIIKLLLFPQQIKQYRSKLRHIQLETQKNNYILMDFTLTKLSFTKIQYTVFLFGDVHTMNKVKEQIFKIREEYPIMVPELNSVAVSQVSHSCFILF